VGVFEVEMGGLIMKKNWWLVLLILLATGTSSVRAESYRLGPRDVLGISVWGFAELQVQEMVVRRVYIKNIGDED
jgi:protein involved in polysaccharide export with SLBB domain